MATTRIVGALAVRAGLAEPVGCVAAHPDLHSPALPAFADLVFGGHDVATIGLSKLEDARAPDFARLVEIHRKPGYDPAELFFDPAAPAAAKRRAAVALARKKLGLRYLMSVVGLDAGARPYAARTAGCPAALLLHLAGITEVASSTGPG